MAKLVKPLSDTQIKKAKIEDKQYKLFDGDGLFLLVFPNGIKRWRLAYSFNKKQNTLSLGKYPEVSLKEAREKRDEIRKKIAKGINPSTKAKTSTNNSFKNVALEYFNGREDLNANYIKDCMQKLEKDVFPYFESRDMNSIEPLEMLKTLQLIDKRGSNVSAKKTFNIVSRIYRYAVTVGKAKRNIINDIDKSVAFRTVEKKNYAHTTDVEVLKDILLAIDDYKGDYNTKMALSILPYVFVRPTNLRHMKWRDIDFNNKLWIISAKEMKMKKDHIVPLTDSVLKVINDMKEISYEVSEYVFPSRLSRSKCLSENTLNFALKRLGFGVTAHGFRHTASTLLHENIRVHKLSSDVIEMQLAHQVGSSVHQVYNKALYLDERVKLMQWWSDFLDELKL